MSGIDMHMTAAVNLRPSLSLTSCPMTTDLRAAASAQAAAGAALML